MNRKFLWGSDVQNKPHLVNWEIVCQPRDLGGLGLRSARENNQALITKLGWQLVSDPNKPWCRALLAKYLHSGSLLTCPLVQAASVTWKSILRCRSLLQLGLRWRIGDGHQVKFWEDVWVGDKPLHEEALLPVAPALMDTPVSHAITTTGEWNETLLDHLLPRTVVDRILAIPISVYGQQEDRVFWNGSQDGMFSVKSAFCLFKQQHHQLPQTERSWKWIWKLRCLEKIKVFVWLLCRGRGLTNSVRFERHFVATPVCPRCENEPETPLHLLRDCPHSRLIWAASTTLPNDFYLLNLDEWVRKNAQATLSSGAPFHNWSTLFLSAIWVIWKSRNAVIFDN
ncbi:hypothetical protein SLA2020_256280 [Shorea laevis]